MKLYLTSLVIGEPQLKTKMSNTHTTTTKLDKNKGLVFLVEMQNGPAPLENKGPFLQKSNITCHRTQQSATCLPKRNKNVRSHSVYSAFTYDCQKLETTQCPSTGKWNNKLLYLHAVEYYSTMKSDELLIFTTWMNFKCTVLREGSQYLCDPIYLITWKGIFIETENRAVVSRGQGA